ncbi:MAG: hypothetical protein HN509_02675 [Halobacteriovoraceae bacterium]|nr:hypothetical protein [Halobacteriovoraceae bacterium]
MKNKILFIINGYGLGNSTRCSAIIEYLKAKGYEIDCITSNNSTFYFSGNENISALLEFSPLKYSTTSEGEISSLLTFINGPRLLKSFIKNVRILKKRIENENYKAVVIDSDYSILPLIFKKSFTLVAINNAEQTVASSEGLPTKNREIFFQYLLERLDCSFHRLVPDLVLAPQWQPAPENTSNIKALPLIVRSGYQSTASPGKLSKILMMFSGAGFQINQRIIRELILPRDVTMDVLGLEGEDSENIRFHGKVHDSSEFVKNCNVMIINAGFSSISEALALKKPMLLLPVNNHYEQLTNALGIENLGVGQIGNPLNLQFDLNEFLSKYQQYTEVFKKTTIECNGASLAAGHIDQLIKSKS